VSRQKDEVMEVRFAIPAPDIEKAKNIAHQIMGVASSRHHNLSPKNPRLYTQPNRVTRSDDPAKGADEYEFPFVLDVADHDLADHCLRDWLEFGEKVARLVSPRFTIDGELKNPEDWKLSDDIGKSEMMRLALTDTPRYTMGMDEPQGGEWRPLEPAEAVLAAEPESNSEEAQAMSLGMSMLRRHGPEFISKFTDDGLRREALRLGEQAMRSQLSKEQWAACGILNPPSHWTK
jgi:hypothetical protein